MKISSVSKKVLASALSAAMVVAFAPTVAFGAQTMSAKVVLEGHAASGKAVAYEAAYYDLAGGADGLTTALTAASTLGTAIDTVIGTDAKGADIPGTMKVTKASTTTTSASAQGEDYIILTALDSDLNTTTYNYWNGTKNATAKAYAMYRFDGATVQALTDFEGAYDVPANVTLDLMGNTVVNDEDGVRDAGALTNTKTTLVVKNGATVKNGTVKGNAIKTNASDDDKTATPNKAIVVDDSAAAASITLADVTVGSIGEKEGAATNTSTVTMIGKVAAGAVAVEALNVGNKAEKKTAEATVAKIGGPTAAGADIKVGKSSKLAVTAEVAKKDLTSSDNTKATAESNAAALTYYAVAGDLTMEEAAALTVDVTSKVSKGTVDNGATANPRYSATNGKVYGFKGTLAAAMEKDSSVVVNATSTGDNIPVVAMDLTGSTTPNLTFGDKADKTGYAVTVKAAAKSAGDWDTKTDVAAKGIVINGAAEQITADNGVLEATASVADDARAYAIEGKLEATSAKGSATVTASALKDASAFAVYGSLEDGTAQGKYTGKIGDFSGVGGAFVPALGSNIVGGSFTQPLVKTTNYDANNYEVVDADGYYTVKQFSGYGVPAFNDAAFPGLKTAVENYLNEKTDAAGVALAEGVTLADLQKQCNATGDKQLQIIVKKGDYNAKKATDAEKAAYDAFCAYAKANLFLEPAEADVKLQTISLGYYASDADKADKKPTVMATVTSLGTVTAGRTATENTQTLDGPSATKPITQVVAFDGKEAVALPSVKSAEDDNYYVKVNKVYAAYAVLNIDVNALKDAAEKGEQAAETITDPAVLAAIVQLQDQNAVLQVEGASKTVKKGKSATIKLGVAASASGAKVTFKKANTAGKKNITVSKAGTVTVKKALKKGTYNVKVKATCGASFKNVVVKIVKK